MYTDRGNRYFYFSFAIAFAVIVLIILLVKDKYDNFVVDHIIEFSIIACVIFGGLLGFLLMAIGHWFETPIGPLSFEMQVYERANRLKKEANLVLAVIFVLVIGAAIVFFKASAFARDDVDTLLGSFMPTVSTAAVEPQAKTGALALQPMLPILVWARIIMVTAVRVGDIAVASFLTFMLVRIYRYNLRLSAFYYSRADAVVLTSDKRFENVKREALPILFDANFDFGKDHPSLVADFAQLIGSLYPPKRKASESNGKKDDPSFPPGGDTSPT